MKHTCANICHTECTSAIGFLKIKTLRFDSKNVYSILWFWINLMPVLGLKVLVFCLMLLPMFCQI